MKAARAGAAGKRPPKLAVIADAKSRGAIEMVCRAGEAAGLDLAALPDGVDEVRVDGEYIKQDRENVVQEVRAAKDQHRKAEQRLVDVLGETRRKSSKAAPDAENDARNSLREKLRPLVEESFDARQRLQQAELKELRRRLAEIEQAIETREKNKDVIVNLRVDELLQAPAKSDSLILPRPVTAPSGGPPPGTEARVRFFQETREENGKLVPITRGITEYVKVQGATGPQPEGAVDEPSAARIPGAASQITFVGPEGMAVAWDVSAPGQFDSEPLICPGRFNFPQGAIYRLKLTNIPGREGAELYPTLEIAPSLPRTDAYLAHNAIPVQFTEEDFDQVLSGNFVTKIIYLPDAEFQELALAGVETLVSTRLDPGMDPIVEADRRGAILAIIRLGNKAPTGEAKGAATAAGGFDLDTREGLAQLDVQAAEEEFEAAKKEVRRLGQMFDKGSAPVIGFREREKEQREAEYRLKRAKLMLEGLARQRADLEAAAGASVAEAGAEVKRSVAKVNVAQANVDAAKAQLKKLNADADGAASNYAFCEKTYERVKKLFDAKSVDEQLLDKASEKFNAAQAALTGARGAVLTGEAAVEQSISALDEARAGLQVAELRLQAAQTRRDRLIQAAELPNLDKPKDSKPDQPPSENKPKE